MKKLHVLIALVVLASAGMISTSIAGQSGQAAEKSAKKKKKAKAKPGPAGPQGPQGPQGAQGTPAPTALTPIAVGKLNSATGADTVLGTDSVGLTDDNVFHGSTGTYCFAGLSPAPRNIIATAGLAGVNATGLIAADADPNGSCPVTHQQGIITVYATTDPFGATVNAPLNVVVY